MGALARNFAFREVTDETPLATPGQKVEHQAYIGLLAERAGVRVPRIVTVIAVSSGAAIVEEEVCGFRLDRALEPEFDPALLTDVWTQVTRMHEAGIAHRDLRLSNIFAVGRLAWIVNLAVGEAPATDKQRAQDVAELLAGWPARSGRSGPWTRRQDRPDGSAEACRPAAGPARVERADAQERAGQAPLLGDLRAALADAADVADLRPERVLRIQIKTVVVVAPPGFALHLLLPQIGNLSRTWTALQDADWLILVVVFLMAGLTYVAAAFGIMGSTDVRLAFGRTVGVSVASDFTNWLAPAGLGGATLQVVYLERAGSDRSEAIASAGLNTAMGGIVHVSLLLGIAYLCTACICRRCGCPATGRCTRDPGRGHPAQRARHVDRRAAGGGSAACGQARQGHGHRDARASGVRAEGPAADPSPGGRVDRGDGRIHR